MRRCCVPIIKYDVERRPSTKMLKPRTYVQKTLKSVRTYSVVPLWLVWFFCKDEPVDGPWIVSPKRLVKTPFNGTINIEDKYYLFAVFASARDELVLFNSCRAALRRLRRANGSLRLYVHHLSVSLRPTVFKSWHSKVDDVWGLRWRIITIWRTKKIFTNETTIPSGLVW